MTPRLVCRDDVPARRWRNGGGTTRELLTWPRSDDWQLRISVADIEVDGPFSSYPGVERWFSVVEGAGVELVVDGQRLRLVRGHAPLCFDGGATASCRLIDGPTHDLNLMLRQASGAMQCAVDGQAWSPGAARCGLYSAVAGRCLTGPLEIAMPAHALLWFDAAPASLVFEANRPASVRNGWWLAATPLEA